MTVSRTPARDLGPALEELELMNERERAALVNRLELELLRPVPQWHARRQVEL